MGSETQTQNPARHWRFSTKRYDTLLPPAPLAEHLEPQTAIAGMRHCMTLRKAEGHFHSAWHHIEYAMNQNVDYFDDEIRRKYIGDAAYLLGRIVDMGSDSRHHRVNPALYAQALTLNIFLPAFTKRALSKEITPTDCENIYQSFGYAFREINNMTYPDASYKSARFAEMLGSALSARTGRPDQLLYPASPREEASAQQTLNHDGYFIKSGDKLPIQTKLILTDKVYDDPTRTIYVDPIARHSLLRAELINPDIPMPIGVCTEIIAELIVEETTTVIDRAGKEALDYMTRSIVAPYHFETSAA